MLKYSLFESLTRTFLIYFFLICYNEIYKRFYMKKSSQLKLKIRAKKGSRKHALKILKNAPDIEAKEDN